MLKYYQNSFTLKNVKKKEIENILYYGMLSNEYVVVKKLFYFYVWFARWPF